MSNSGEIIQMEFHNKATELFFAFFRSFEKEASGIDRGLQEYDFQKLKKKYVTSFEGALQSIAEKILFDHKNEKQFTEIDPLLRQFLTDYLHRFVNKINGL